MTGFVKQREQIVEAITSKIQEQRWQPDVIAGTATAAISWAAFVAAEMKLPMVYIRPEPKAHGAKKQIEGYMPAGSKVVIVEDLFSTGGSSIKSAEAVRNEGQSQVLGAISIMNWELPTAIENFQNAGIDAVSLTGFSEIIPLAVRNGDISEKDAEKILEFRKDPENWAKKYL
jgi:orotate phosphoribosyltransferase